MQSKWFGLIPMYSVHEGPTRIIWRGKSIGKLFSLPPVMLPSSRRKDVGGLWQWKHPPHSTYKAPRLCANRGTASLPLPYKYTGTTRAKKILWFDHATLTAEIAASEAKSIQIMVGFDAPNRSGFWAGRGFTDQIHNLPQTLERIGSSSKQQFYSMLVSPLRSTPWTETTLWRILAADGMPAKLLRLIKV